MSDEMPSAEKDRIRRERISGRRMFDDEPAPRPAPESFASLARRLAEHVYGEFLGGLGEVWTTCSCGARIDATPAEGRTSGKAFKANWSEHFSEVATRVLPPAVGGIDE